MSNNDENEKIIVEDLDPGFRDEIASLPGGENITRCFACGTCAAGCPVTHVDEEYNCRKIIRQVLFGMREKVLTSPLIWFCLTCYRCTARCPQEVNFADVMKAIRYLAVKEGHADQDIMISSDEIDRYTQIIRRDLMKNTVKGRKQIIEELKNKIGKTLDE
jgi:heterodisulfide reductase subunit C